MTEAAVKTETIEPAAPKDENGIDIITGPYESWNFPDTSYNFYARFRRLVNVGGILYAEVDYSLYMNGSRKVRWCRLTEFTALAKCKPGDDLNCRWVLGKPFVFARQASERGRPMTPEEWRKIDHSRHVYPEFYNRIVEA